MKEDIFLNIGVYILKYPYLTITVLSEDILNSYVTLQPIFSVEVIRGMSFTNSSSYLFITHQLMSNIYSGKHSPKPFIWHFRVRIP